PHGDVRQITIPWVRDRCGRVAKRAVKCGRTGRFRQVRWTFGRAVGRCPRPVSDLAPTVSAGGESLGDGVLPALDSAPVGLMAALGEDRQLAVGEVRGGEGGAGDAQRVVALVSDDDVVVGDENRGVRTGDDGGGDESEHGADDRSDGDHPGLVEPAELLDRIAEGDGEPRGQRAQCGQEEAEGDTEAHAHEADDDDVGAAELEDGGTRGGARAVVRAHCDPHSAKLALRNWDTIVPNWYMTVPLVVFSLMKEGSHVSEGAGMRRLGREGLLKESLSALAEDSQASMLEIASAIG